MDTKAVKSGLGKIKSMFGGVAKTAGKALKIGGKGLLAGAGLVGAVVGAAGAMTIGTAKWAKNLKVMSTQTGVSVKNTLALREAFKAAGVEISDDADLISDFQEKIEDAARGGGTSGEGLPMFGLDPHAMRRILDPMRQFEVLMEAVEKSGLSVQSRAFALDKIFGGQGFKMVHLANEYSAYMDQARKDTEDLGNALDDTVMSELEHMLKVVARIKLQFRLGMVGVAKALPLDKILSLIDKVMNVTGNFLGDPDAFMTELWLWFKGEMIHLWDILLGRLTATMTELVNSVMPKITLPKWLGGGGGGGGAPTLPGQNLIPPAIKDKAAPLLESIDKTLTLINRKPAVRFAG